jgi:Scramblase
MSWRGMKWGGFFREAFTSADNFEIEFEPEFQDAVLRQLVFAAALTLNHMTYQRRGVD